MLNFSKSIKQRQTKYIIIAASLIALMSLSSIIISAQASNVSINFEAENGTLSSCTQAFTDSNASDGNAVQFNQCLNENVFGAQLPINYDLNSLTGNKIFVATNGNDSSGNGSMSAPYKTLDRAIIAAKDGDNIVLRGGTYPIAQRKIVFVNKIVSILAYPGEVPIFDGSIAAPSNVSSEGDLRYFAYQPIPANTGSGLNITELPDAIFSGDSPIGLAAERGWKCVTGSKSYVAANTPTACPTGSSKKIISAYYPDQVWVGGNKLIQVTEKNLVKKGYFYVPRDAATDINPSLSNVFIHKDDAIDLGKLRVSYSGGSIANLDSSGYNTQGDFLRLYKAGIKISGIKIFGHSAAWDSYAIRVMFDNISLTDTFIEDISNIGLSYGATKNLTLQRVSFNNNGWQAIEGGGIDFSLLDSYIHKTNIQRDFNRGPKAGAIKLSRAHNARFINTHFVDNYGFALWCDESCYKMTVANSKFINNNGASVFYEISHDLTLVNNLFIAHPESEMNLRLAASSGLKIVNNTVIGGTKSAVDVHSDGRTKKYDSNADGTPDRYCSEHVYRYTRVNSPTFEDVCINGLISNLDITRTGRYGTVNQTYGLNFQPSVDIFVNNILSSAGKDFSCAALCVYGYSHWLYNGKWVDSSVMMDSIFHQSRTSTIDDPAVGATIFDGNLYQVLESDLISRFRSGTGVSGFNAVDQRQGASFDASGISALKTNMSNSVYNLNVETYGKSGSIGQWVNTTGQRTAELESIHQQAATVPSNVDINQFIGAGSRYYGYR
jgi:hypothetical protein